MFFMLAAPAKKPLSLQQYLEQSPIRMSKQEINTKLEELLAEPMDAQRASAGKDLLEKYQSILVHDHKEQLEKFLADGGQKEDLLLARMNLMKHSVAYGQSSHKAKMPGKKQKLKAKNKILLVKKGSSKRLKSL